MLTPAPADPRSVEIPQSLKELKAAAAAAHDAYHGHKFQGDRSDLDAVIAYDMEDKRLVLASVRAKIAYENALAAFMATEAA
jgi:hypothetical protein